MIHVAEVGAHETEARALNYHRGEYDAAAYYWVVVGIPVYCSFRGCAHVVLGNNIGEGERRERLSRFARTYFGLESLPQQFGFAIKPFSGRRMLMFVKFFLRLCGNDGSLSHWPCLFSSRLSGPGRAKDLSARSREWPSFPCPRLGRLPHLAQALSKAVSHPTCHGRPARTIFRPCWLASGPRRASGFRLRRS